MTRLLATIRNPSLWEEGERRIGWASRHSPVLARLARTIAAGGSLAGKRVALVIHLGPKTAYLAILLHEAGARVVAVSSNPGSVHDDVAAALARRGIGVHAVRNCTREEWEWQMDRVLEFAPELIVDDGAELVTRLVRRGAGSHVLGSAEETTTGLHRLRALEREGKLTWPAIAVNDARCKHLFDNRFGTGQSALASVMRNTNLWLGGKNVVVAGFGWVGRGIAEDAAGLGAQVIVTEIDPVAALEAHTSGYRVMSMAEAAPIGDIFITCTGSVNVIDLPHFARMKDGAILANAGHHGREINTRGLEEIAVTRRPARPNVEEFALPDRRTLYLLASGEPVNLTAAEGHPIEIMDLTFAVQASAIHYLARYGAALSPGVQGLPAAIDAGIARTKLETLGVTLDAMTPEQSTFLAGWE